MSLSFSDFIYTQLILKIPKPTTSFASKIVIVTGANSGIGKETAKHIVSLGARKVILACRSTSRGNDAKADIESTLKCSQDILEVWELDLESSSSIERFADRAKKLPRLDVLINNAGIWPTKFQQVWGTERSIAVNVIGTFLLSLLLLSKLEETAKIHDVPTHLTIVGSALFNTANYPEEHGTDIFAWLGDETHTKMRQQYALSKLFQVFVVRQLGDLVNPIAGDKSPNAGFVVINCMDPCACKGTGLGREMPAAMKPVAWLFHALLARTAEEGSRLVVQAASAGKESHGGYFRSAKLKDLPPVILGEEGRKRGQYVWRLVAEKLEEIHPGILQSIERL